LLLHRREIEKWAGAVSTRGVSCVPLSLYFRGARAKAEIALVKGKKLHDKRDAIRDRELRREADRAMRERRKA
jgi:SsrA-binding protein